MELWSILPSVRSRNAIGLMLALAVAPTQMDRDLNPERRLSQRRRLRRASVRKRRSAVLIRRIVFVFQSGAPLLYADKPTDKSPWKTIHLTAAGTIAEANMMEKVRFAKDAWILS
jgi:hypothetical protein